MVPEAAASNRGGEVGWPVCHLSGEACSGQELVRSSVGQLLGGCCRVLALAFQREADQAGLEGGF